MMWDIIINNHGASISAMSGDPLNGRNLKDGYIRGCGLQFGNIANLCAADPLFVRAYALTKGRTAVTDNNLLNLFLLIKFYLPRLPPGDIAEFGSFRGGSAIFMAVVAQELCPGTKVYGFDSFAGMPPTDARRDAHKAGDFGETSVQEIRLFAENSGVRNLELIQGMFEESIPRELPSIGPLRLSHIDCDLYDGVMASYEGSRTKMVPGGYIVFDDPLVSSCLGAFEAIENLVIRRDGLCAEQVFPHLVYRAPA
jgi:Macrocin-O-methyltransferase (TylF)